MITAILAFVLGAILAGLIGFRPKRDDKPETVNEPAPPTRTEVELETQQNENQAVVSDAIGDHAGADPDRVSALVDRANRNRGM